MCVVCVGGICVVVGRAFRWRSVADIAKLKQLVGDQPSWDLRKTQIQMGRAHGGIEPVETVRPCEDHFADPSEGSGPRRRHPPRGATAEP